MSATWDPSSRPAGAATGTPFTVWPPAVLVVPEVPAVPGAEEFAPLAVQPTPVLGSQVDALLELEPAAPELPVLEAVARAVLPEPLAPEVPAPAVLPEPAGPE